MIGAGNVATHLGEKLKFEGYDIQQIYSRTTESAKRLANIIGCLYTTDINVLENDADVYICALKDSALQELIPNIVHGKNTDKSIFLHTSGSLPVSIWSDHAQHYGVLYPMQTFSLNKKVDLDKVSIFVEASDESTLQLIKKISNDISKKVFELTSEQRKFLHVAAVFACNFTNHMYTLSKDILNKIDIPFEVMFPLIEETADKIHSLSPKDAQTGPAVRNDLNVLESHLKMLDEETDLKDIYELLSKNIYKRSLK